MAKGYSKEQGKSFRDLAAKWMGRIEGSSELEKDWRKEATQATVVYMGKPDKAYELEGSPASYNILFSNVETIVPAVINSAPIPDIRRRFADDDKPGRDVAEMLERVISVQVDDGALAVELEAEAQDAFLAGRGLVRMKFNSDDAEQEQLPTDTQLKDETDDEPAEAAFNPNEAGVEPAGQSEYSQSAIASQMGSTALSSQSPMQANNVLVGAAQQLGLAVPQKNERITFEAVPWADFRRGAAARWGDAPWMAFRHRLEPDDEKDLCDADLVRSQEDVETDKELGDDTRDVWEIWIKRDRTVLFIRATDKKIIRRVKDPLKLSKFFPIAEPMQPITVNGRLTPVCPYTIYRKLAEELDTMTKRISVLTKGLKARGLAAGHIGEIEKLASLGDNEIAAVDNLEGFLAAGGNLEQAIAWWPIDKIVTVIKELVAQRELTKQAIYEITGISDIVRGASKASETLGAQQIKTQWGSLRIQKMQRQIERTARELFVMMAECIPQLFSRQTLTAISGIEVTPEMELILANPIAQRYKVDVESDSTIRADVTRRKGEMAEFLAGSGQYFAAVGPLVQQGQLPPDVAIGIYLATARLFKLGKSVEDLLDGMVKQATAQAGPPQIGPDGQPMPQQGAPNPQQLQQQAEQQLAEQESAARNAELEAKKRESDAKVRLTDAQTRNAIADGRVNRSIKRIELAIARAEAIGQGIAIPPHDETPDGLDDIFPMPEPAEQPIAPQPAPGAPLL